MNRGDANYLFAALVIILAAFFWQKESGVQSLWQQSQTQLSNCKAEFQGFKDGVNYGR